MHRVTSSKGTVLEDAKSIGSEMVIKDGDGKEIKRRPLTDDELAQVATEGQPTPKETALAGIASASTLTALKAALTKWIGG